MPIKFKICLWDLSQGPFKQGREGGMEEKRV